MRKVHARLYQRETTAKRRVISLRAAFPEKDFRVVIHGFKWAVALFESNTFRALCA